MNANEINNLDPDDIGLKQIMGNRFHDETTGTQQTQKARANGKSTYTTQKEMLAQKPINLRLSQLPDFLLEADRPYA